MQAGSKLFVRLSEDRSGGAQGVLAMPRCADSESWHVAVTRLGPAFSSSPRARRSKLPIASARGTLGRLDSLRSGFRDPQFRRPAACAFRSSVVNLRMSARLVLRWRRVWRLNGQCGVFRCEEGPGFEAPNSKSIRGGGAVRGESVACRADFGALPVPLSRLLLKQLGRCSPSLGGLAGGLRDWQSVQARSFLRVCVWSAGAFGVPRCSAREPCRSACLAPDAGASGGARVPE